MFVNLIRFYFRPLHWSKIEFPLRSVFILWWDTVAAPVADVSRKWGHATSRPIGRSPLHAIIE